MKIQKAIVQETLHIALGILALDVIMCVVFALFRRFDYTVVLGALLGTVFAVANFFLLGVTVQKAMDKGENVKRFMHSSYVGRMLLYVACIVLGALLPCFHTLAAVLPLLMPQVVIYAMRLLGIYRPEKQPSPEEGSNS